MFESIVGLFLKYGLFGMLFSSIISSLFFFPAFSSFLIPLYLALKFNPYLLLIVITGGAIIGQLFNYYFGVFSSEHLIKHEKDIRKAEQWLNKWGDLSVFIVNLIPFIPADFVSVLVGFLRMDSKPFIISMGLGKLFQYALLIFGIELLTRFLPFGIFRW